MLTIANLKSMIVAPLMNCATSGISNVCSKSHSIVVKDYWLSCCIFNNTKPHLIISLPYVNIRLYPVLEISFYPHYAMGACQEGHIALAQMLVRLYSDHWHFVWFIVLMCVNLSKWVQIVLCTMVCFHTFFVS